jgi:hypothetical protein
MSEPETGQGYSLTDEFIDPQYRNMGRMNKIRNAHLAGDETDMILLNEFGRMLGIGAMGVANDVYLDSTVGQEGRMNRLYLRGEQARKGIPSNPGEEMQKPSRLDQVFNRKKVKEYEEYEREVGLK